MGYAGFAYPRKVGERERVYFLRGTCGVWIPQSGPGVRESSIRIWGVRGMHTRKGEGGEGKLIRIWSMRVFDRIWVMRGMHTPGVEERERERSDSYME